MVKLPGDLAFDDFLRISKRIFWIHFFLWLVWLTPFSLMLWWMHDFMVVWMFGELLWLNELCLLVLMSPLLLMWFWWRRGVI